MPPSEPIGAGGSKASTKRSRLRDLHRSSPRSRRTLASVPEVRIAFARATCSARRRSVSRYNGFLGGDPSTGSRRPRRRHCDTVHSATPIASAAAFVNR